MTALEIFLSKQMFLMKVYCTTPDVAHRFQADDGIEKMVELNKTVEVFMANFGKFCRAVEISRDRFQVVGEDFEGLGEHLAGKCDS